MKIKIYFFLSNFIHLLNLDPRLGNLLYGSHSLLEGIWGPKCCEREKTAPCPFQKPTFLKQTDSTQVFLLGTDPVSPRTARK